MDMDTRRKVDSIAIFGTQNSDTASAMIIKKVLFCDDDASDLGRKTYSSKAVSRQVSCMTLFPDHSGYELYLVLFNHHGRGMVWDWIREEQIMQLNMLSTLATAGNPAVDAGVGGDPSPRRRVIVTMADGAEDEWESCWWNITTDELQDPMVSLPALPIVDKNKPRLSLYATKATKPPLILSGKRFERKTNGVCIPEQQKTHSAENNKPIQFIAYLVWNHYRIGVSSQMGICMIDLEEPESGLVADRQWITFLREREDLIDIGTFGNNLIVTLKTGHLVWSFYGRDRTPIVSKDGLGLRMDRRAIVSIQMARNLRHTLWLSWHAAHTPILLLDTVVSYNETSPIQQAPIQDQLATVQVQVEVLAIGPAQEQDVEYVNVVEDQDMQVENADGIYDLEEEET
ncbi:MAG: hypothetical protein JOS17DRAFT_821019 [Linnemannia elongata]|nr:MAG: hypothetical protein JOS17DRAFT_821019 [Linnemannia elongata]